MRRETGLVEHELLPYYQDVYDHVVRAAEQTDTLRDMIATIFETSSRSARAHSWRRRRRRPSCGWLP